MAGRWIWIARAAMVALFAASYRLDPAGWWAWALWHAASALLAMDAGLVAFGAVYEAGYASGLLAGVKLADESQTPP